MSQCKCGKEILWAIGEQGQKIPLDAKAPVYILTGEGGLMGPRCKREKKAYVTHFATCKNANEFSASKKEEENTKGTS